MRGLSARTKSLAADDCAIGLKPTNERLLCQDDILGGDDCMIGLKPTNKRFLCQDNILGGRTLLIEFKPNNERFLCQHNILTGRRLLIGLKPTNERLLCQDDILGGGGIGGEKAPVDETPVPQVRVLRVLPQNNPCFIVTGKQFGIRQWCDTV
jgi:hypothetical protein